jgi:hypothetical protein
LDSGWQDMLNPAVAEKTARDLYQVELYCACSSMRADVCVNNQWFRERPNDLVRIPHSVQCEIQSV